MAYYIFRINYSEYFNYIQEEIRNGRLRQGWGGKDMDIRKGYDTFEKAWNNKWPNEDKKNIQSKYKNLCIMKNIRPEDYIIVPKLSMEDDCPGSYFTLLKCTRDYSFELPSFTEDFGHVIGVEVLFSCNYQYPWDATKISAKFKAYQSPLNNVWSETVISSVGALVDRNEIEHIHPQMVSKSYINTFSEGMTKKYDELVFHVLNMLRDMSPEDFEKLITELFVKNGYTLKRRHDYDKEGGDIDITLSLDDYSILGCLFGYTTSVDDFEINIQAKKKRGNDLNDIKAVNQLIERKRTKNSNCVEANIVIDLTDVFQKETEDKAKKYHIVLINGYQFASLLIQFGLAGEMGE